MLPILYVLSAAAGRESWWDQLLASGQVEKVSSSPTLPKNPMLDEEANSLDQGWPKVKPLLGWASIQS